MYYCEAPLPVPNEAYLKPSVFLAGGITGCLNWQGEIRKLLADFDLTLLNPRRADFPMDDPDAAEAQILWEHQQLHAATAVSFWFPPETLCPITLFELGAWSHWQGQRFDAETQTQTLCRKPIFVGAHPNYQRRQDILIQMKLQRPEVAVVSTLDELARQIAQWVIQVV